MLGLGWSTLISLGGCFMCEAWYLWALALIGATVEGGTQALSRSLFGLMAPQARSGECFDFHEISSRFAGIVRPALFAFQGQVTGTSRLNIAALIIFFLGGIFLLTRADEEEGRRLADEESRAFGLA